MDPNSLKKFGATIETFQRGSTMKILETTNEIFNIDKVQKKGREIWGQSSAGKLMKKMDEIFGLSIQKLKILSSTADILGENGDEEIRNLLRICPKEEECEELKRLGEYF